MTKNRNHTTDKKTDKKTKKFAIIKPNNYLCRPEIKNIINKQP